MTTVSALPPVKRKKLVYGKGYSNSTLSSFFDDEDELSAAKSTTERPPNNKAVYPVQKTQQKSRLKPARPLAKRHDTFDVPTSDDEISSPVKIAPPPKFEPNLYDDTGNNTSHFVAKKHRSPEASPEAQLKQELAKATSPPQIMPSPNERKGTTAQLLTANLPKREVEEIHAASAAARLAARKRRLGDSAPSGVDETGNATGTFPNTTGLSADDLDNAPRKRARTEVVLREISADVLMDDGMQPPSCEAVTQKAKMIERGRTIYELPDSSADESTVPKTKENKKPARRGKLATYASRSIAHKGVSAPARLAEMIATDTDTTAPSTHSPSPSTTPGSTPQQPSTPPSARIASPKTAIKATGTMTPKQAQLWDRLLPSDPIVPSPSALAMKELTISGRRRTGLARSVPRQLMKSQSDVPRRRTRLVDRLKASALSSDDGSSEQEDDDDDDDDDDDNKEDVEMGNVSTNVQSDDSKIKKSEGAPKLQRQTSQSQGQSQPQSGPKITYSRTRSYLPEETVEDDLMLGLNDTPHESTAWKSALTSQKSAFDLDDDSEEDSARRIRTIHELRASGSNTRGMWDIEEALEDIKQHSISQRSRRRTALVELATKLADKSFAARFVGQSCELKLAAECGTCPDEVADFVLAVTFAMIMSSEPSEHAVSTLHEQGVVGWLTQLLETATDIRQMAKDRRNNMSKASQSSLLELNIMLLQLDCLWAETKPLIMTPRLIALKALDQLVSRIRRLGDKTELLSSGQLKGIPQWPVQTPEQSNQIDVTLSISILESLSTASLSLNWPSSVLDAIRDTLPHATLSMTRHTQFLALRLCLNLTNDNKRNCALLATSGHSFTVHYLLHTIKNGFENLNKEEEDEKRMIALDLLVLAVGIMINLGEHCNAAREQVVGEPDLLTALIERFRQGQKQMLEAESVEESISNVTFGYLAVMLANLCQNPAAKTFIASQLPARNLGMLIEAVAEFVLHHQKVDTMDFEGEEGQEVWGAFTEKLKIVLARLKEIEYDI